MGIRHQKGILLGAWISFTLSSVSGLAALACWALGLGLGLMVGVFCAVVLASGGVVLALLHWLQRRAARGRQTDCSKGFRMPPRWLVVVGAVIVVLSAGLLVRLSAQLIGDECRLRNAFVETEVSVLERRGDRVRYGVEHEGKVFSCGDQLGRRDLWVRVPATAAHDSKLRARYIPDRPWISRLVGERQQPYYAMLLPGTFGLAMLIAPLMMLSPVYRPRAAGMTVVLAILSVLLVVTLVAGTRIFAALDWRQSRGSTENSVPHAWQ